MVQVDKKRVFINIFLFVFILLFFAGCSFKTVNKEDIKQEEFELISSTKTYENIHKDQLLLAVKKLLLASFDDEILIDSYRMRIDAVRPSMIAALSGVDIQHDNFLFKVKEQDNKLEASVLISTTKGVIDEKTIYFKNEHYIYEIFWSRLDYILGLRDDYDFCGVLFLKTSACDVLNPYNNFLDEDDRLDKKE